MGYVRIDPHIGTKVADRFGPRITRDHANRIQVRAKALADARAKHSSVADRIDLSVHHHGTDHRVVLSVRGRDGSQIASFLEWGYHNVRADRDMPGLHIMRDAAFGG